MPEYADQPAVLVHDLIIGDDYRPLVAFRLQASDGTYYSLTGATGVAKIKDEYGGNTLATPTVTVSSDATSDYFYWTLADDVTALLKPQAAKLSIRLTFSDGTKKTVVRTRMNIVPDGTA